MLYDSITIIIIGEEIQFQFLLRISCKKLFFKINP